METQILSQLKWRYATKKFDVKRRLSDQKIAVLKEAFNLTATSYGLQPLKLVIVSNKVLQQSLVPFSMDQAQVADASHVLIICRESVVSTQYIKEHFKRVENVRNTPREILDPFEDFLVDSFSKKEHGMVETWMEKQAYLALGNLLTVCALEEIDSCPMEGFEPEKYDDHLGLKERGLRSVLVLPVGYRAEDDLFSKLEKVRRGVEEVVIELS